MRFHPAWLLALLFPSLARADGPVDYLRQIKPIFAEKCFACHGALQQKGELRLDTVKAMRAGGENGPVLEGLLLDRILGHNGLRRMPPSGEGEPLSDVQVALVRRWIAEGANGPANEQPEADPRDHWSFRPPVRPALPEKAAANPVDAFLAAERERHGLVPRGPADRRTLLRRVYLDLVGLPPSRAEQAAFVGDPSPDAFEKVVDRLLASPQYGERWARHWMDIWRYSDWWGLGQEVRNSQKHIWHWRDWIIESLNSDKGYDQMLREMLAADELYPNDLDRLRATGYLVRHYFRFNRSTWLDETVEHTSKAFLGLTLNCTKCHDHKYDPFAQADYYRLRAFFEPYQVRMDQVAGEIDYEKDGLPRVFDCNLEAPTYLFIRGDDRNPAKDRPLSPALPRVLTWEKLDIQPIPLPPEAHNPGLRPHVLENYLQVERKKLAKARKMLEDSFLIPDERSRALQTVATAMTAIEALEARAAADLAKATRSPQAKELALKAAQLEARATVAKAHEDLARLPREHAKTTAAEAAAVQKKLAAANAALAQGQKALESHSDAYTALRGSVKTPESNLETGESLNRPFPATSTGRRAALARWLTDRRNPLTARVAVNHIWARHFGTPLVATVFDFGRKGSPPTHPALLDYLAIELIDSGWSMKHLHRLLVTSEAYRQASSLADFGLRIAESKTDPQSAIRNPQAKDPENRYYWRMNSTRMEAQLVRDSLLSLAGELDPKLGGPSVPVSDEASRRRSLYYVHSHNDHQRFLGLFDDASVRECYRRSESIVPQQALALSNSKLALDMAGRIEERLHQELGPSDDAGFIRAAFEMVLAGSPTAEESAECGRALQEWRELGKGRPDPLRRARRQLIAALVNHNDFITIR
jgi:mono/diheme cytochrome c family protein